MSATTRTYQDIIVPKQEGCLYLACDAKSHEPVMLVWWSPDAFWPYVYDENTRAFHRGSMSLMNEALGDSCSLASSSAPSPKPRLSSSPSARRACI